jgi:hypothetical protein
MPPKHFQFFSIFLRLAALNNLNLNIIVMSTEAALKKELNSLKNEFKE